VNDDFDFKYRHRISSENIPKINDSSLDNEQDLEPVINLSHTTQII